MANTERTATAEDVLSKLCGRRNVPLNDVEEALASDVLLSDMMATHKGLYRHIQNTLLHVAAGVSNSSVLPMVVQAYKKAKLLPTALKTSNSQNLLPLHIAIQSANYESTVFLMKECEEHCPETLQPTDEGCTLLHMAISSSWGASIVKYLLTEYKELCEPLLLVKWKDEIPLHCANSSQIKAEFSLEHAKGFAETSAKKALNPMTRDHIMRVHTSRQQDVLKQAKEIVSLLQQPTMQAKAEESKRQAKEREEKLFHEKKLRLNSELEGLLQLHKWDTLTKDYVLSTDEDVQEIAVNFLASAVSSTEITVTLPPLSVEVLALLKQLLERPEDDPVLKSSLKMLTEFSKGKMNNSLFFTDSEGEYVVSLILKRLCSVATDIQYLCATLLLHLFMNREDSFDTPEEWIQPLLLVKKFTVNPEVKNVLSEVVERLGVSSQVPNPGMWSTRDVSFWMESNTSIEKRSQFAKAFRDAGIDGLHLLELSPTEMIGLGVKFVSDQRKLSGLIDELRRLNMRSIVGRKDVFLSYAHMNVQFAQQIKKALNDSNYTVWIDTAGIRAGQKWRTEIAHGIHDCQLFIFIMTPRSTNSQYCHDELSLAEEYKKPIITVRYQHAEEMDPGLKLTISRRQWVDFTDSSQFSESCTKLLEAVQMTIGAGSGPEREDYEQGSDQVHSVKSEPLARDVEVHDISSDAVKELVKKEVEKVRREFLSTVQSLEAKVAELNSRVAALEDQGDR